jgi:MoxR-like ATPase
MGGGGPGRPLDAATCAAADHRGSVASEASRPRLLVPLIPLFGRHAETAAVTRSLVTGRLVTLAGPGGVGKTRQPRHAF